jgi:hypothetical protein
MKKLLFLLAILTVAGLSAQTGFQYTGSAIKKLPLSGTVTPTDIKNDFFPMLQNLEAPKPGGEEYNAYLKEIKRAIKPLPWNQPMDKAGPAAPLKGISFEGNRFPSGIPNDNHIAISNGGLIVSMVNTTVAAFDTTGKLLKTWSFDAFSDTLKIKAGKYDGRVLYDPEQDRFVVTFLAGFADSTSFAILGFSKTNDPLKGWNLYKIPGNPLKDATWSDFPMVSLTKNEYFLTLNAIGNGQSWQAGFRRSYIWQINKMDGYNGAVLGTKLYTDLKFNSKPIRNLCPIQGGSGLAGPDCWFLSNRNFDKSNDSIFLYHLMGKMNTPDTIINMKVVVAANNTYGVPPDALQPLADTLQTNDCRVLSGFIENGAIQFVGNSLHAPSGRAGILHGIISDVVTNPLLSLNIVAHQDMDYGYPSISYAGKSTADDDAIIVVNYTSDKYTTVAGKKHYVYPGNAALYYKSGLYTDTVSLKAGTSIIELIQGPDRWGDYSGSQLRYNHPGEVWLGATFGHYLGGVVSQDAYGTWISQLKSSSQLAGIETNKKPAMQANIYPSPLLAYKPLTVDFTIDEAAVLKFSVWDMQGRLARVLLDTKVDEGKNRFSFNLNALPAGIYLLKIDSKEENVMVRKMVVE